MRGNDADPGMMILCIRDIFDYISSNRKREFELRVSYMEVYNEEINDLLGIGPVSNIDIVHRYAFLTARPFIFIRTRKTYALFRKT